MLGKNSCLILELHCNSPKQMVCLGFLDILIWVIDQICLSYVSLLENTESKSGPVHHGGRLLWHIF